jgi:hypothetical protein
MTPKLGFPFGDDIEMADPKDVLVRDSFYLRHDVGLQRVLAMDLGVDAVLIHVLFYVINALISSRYRMGGVVFY